MPQFEIRAVIDYSEEDEDHRRVVVRDSEHSIYQSFEVNPNADPHSEAAKHLNTKKKEIELPEHVRRGLK